MDKALATAIDRLTIALPPTVSATWTVKNAVTDAAGVPETLPPVETLSPTGSEPTLMLQE
jgi:hypothetical protein